MIYRARNRFAKKVYRAIHPEFKAKREYFSNSMGTYASPSVLVFNNLLQNDTTTGRVGNRVCFKQFMLRFYIRFNISQADNDSLFRIILFKDRFPEGGGVPDLESIIYIGDGSPPNLNNFRNLDYTKRIKILKDTGVLNVGHVGSAPPTRKFLWKFNMNMVTVYDGDLGDSTDIYNNLIGMYLWTNEAENFPSYIIAYSLRWIDC